MQPEGVQVHSERLMQVQVELVHMALDYSGGGVSDVFVYGSLENGSYAYNAFFGVGGNIFTVGQLDSVSQLVLPARSVSERRAFLSGGSELLQRFAEGSAASGQVVPTEFRIHFDVAKGNLESVIEYDMVHSNSQTLTSADVFVEWRNQVTARYE